MRLDLATLTALASAFTARRRAPSDRDNAHCWRMPMFGLPAKSATETHMNRRRFALNLGATLILADVLRAKSKTAVNWDSVPQSPVVHRDGKITFLFPKGRATSVVLNISGMRPQKMTASRGGFWSITVGPIPPAIYSYTFSVDGILLLDPLNPWVKKNLFHSGNLVLVPGNPPSPWQETPVPHGAVTRNYYYSHVSGVNRSYYVYTPPGYDAHTSQRYPALYLLHGYSDTPSAWVDVGRANFILDNLIYREKAKPMIVVMPNGYGDPAIAARNSPALSDAHLWQRNLRMFQQSFLTEVMPRVQADYRVKHDRQQRAIAGLSMGGGEALVTGLNHLDQFAWIGGFSSFVGNTGMNFRTFFPKLSARDNKQIELLWVSCGRQDPLVGKANRDLNKWLDQLGVKYRRVWTPGMHQWRVWRNNLIHFAAQLFV